MPPKDFIFFAYSFNKDGKAVKLKNKEIADELESKDLSWAHLDGNHVESKEWLQKNVDYLDHLVIDALFAEETRPRIIEFDKGILLILRGIDDSNENGHIELGLETLVQNMETECSPYNFEYANINTYDFQVMLLKD